MPRKIYDKSGRSKFKVWILAAALGAGAPMIWTATPVMAQDEPQDVREDRVPPAVLTTARQQILDSRDVVYRKQGNTFIINFTTPSNLRLQTRVHEDGRLERPSELAPNQPDNAPKRDERERLLLAWQQRVTAGIPAPVTPPPSPPGIPPAIPPAPAPVPLPGAAPFPVATQSVPITPQQVPPQVLQAFDRFTAGASNVSYMQNRIGDSVQYEANYTHPDGARREVTVNATGNLVAGPLVLAETVDDKQLEADRGDQGQPTKITQLSKNDVPEAANRTINPYVQGAADVRYRRDTYADGKTAIQAHWVLPANGKRYFMSVAENGTVVTAPRLSSFQVAPPDAEGVRSTATTRDRLPAPVRTAMDQATKNDSGAKYYEQWREGKTFYGVEYGPAGKRMWLRTDATGNTVAGPVAAETARKPATAAPAPAAPGRTTPAPAAPPPPAAAADDIPAPVKAAVAARTQGGKNVKTVHRTEAGKDVYHVTWTDAQGDAHQARLDAQGKPIVTTGK